MSKETFLYNIDENKVNSLLQDVESNSTYFSNITTQVAQSYTADLDALMLEIKENRDNKISGDTLEKYINNLSNILYFIGERMEAVGIRNDVARSLRQEVYNKTYLENDVEKEVNGKKVKPTKDANIAVAEEESKYESVISNIYERTYRIIKFKIDAGFEKLSSLKKQLSRRMQETDLSMYTPKGKQILNEDIEKPDYF